MEYRLIKCLLTLSPTTTTSYTVTGTQNGCTGTASGTITVNAIPVVTVNSPNICPGSGTTLIALGATTYVWSTGATTSSINVSPSSNTSYTVIGTTLGCSASAVSTVTLSSVLTVNAGLNDTICQGSSTILNATPANAGSTFSWSPAAGLSSTNIANPTANPSTNTVYTVTITDANGCSGSNQVTVSIDPPLSATATAVNSTCFGAHNGTATAHPIGGNAPYQYSWTGGGNAASYSGLGSGTYNVTITDAIGCSTTATTSISEPAAISASISNFTNPSCNGSCNGSATALAGGGTGAFTYSWNTAPVQSSATSNSLCAGNYVCTTTDANGCTSSTSVTISQPSIVTIAPITAVTGCAGGSTNLSASASGGTGPYNYVWSPATGLNSTTISNPIASPGSTTVYTLNVTDNNGCPATAQTITVAASTQLTAAASGSSTICAGSSAQLNGSASLGSGGPYTYSWSPAAGLNNANIANPIATPLVTTTYVLTVNDGCSSQTANATITVNPIPTINVNSPSICPGSTATLIASGATSYIWSNGSTGAQINVTPAATTTYTVTGTQNGCSSNAISTVTLSTVLTVNAGVGDTICQGGNTTLSVSPANAGSIFTWSPATGLSNAAIANPIASPTSSTIYTVTVTDANGCSGTNQVTVSIDPALNANVSTTDATCFGANNGHATITPSGGTAPYSYSWAGGCTTATNNGLGPGTFNVTITDAIGCTTTSSATISEPSQVNAFITASYPATCANLCDGIATASASGGTGAFIYSWNTISPQTSATATALCASSYICTATDANGCTNTTTVSISQPSPVVIAPVTAITGCAGGSTNLSASATGGAAPYNFSWSPTSGLSSASIYNPVANPTSAITYTVTVTDDNGCPGNSQTVSVNASVQLTITANGTNSICPGTSTPLNATAAFGNGGPYSYSWSPSTGLNNPNSANPSASPTVTTTYTVTANDGCSAPQSTTVTVTVFPSPTANLTANVTSGCAPLCVNFTNGSTAGSGGTYSWTLGNGEGSSTDQNPYHCYENPGQYSVSLTATTSDGCTGNIIIPNMIDVYALPEAAFTSTPNPVTVLSPEVSFINLSSTDVVSWLWNFGDGGTSDQSNPLHTYPAIEDQSYITTLIVHNANGCEDTITGVIEVRPDFTFFVPNCFSPNGDGVNDSFNGKGIGIAKFHMGIYDRWGLLIWETDKLGEDWDGRANGGKLMAQEDTYVWRVVLTDVFNKEHKYLGKVTIVK
ncbi:MAG: gliding motility-associated C-terminal domain-containing protein [Bacteroidetes bacterium]|nr:gliding motility-associated C-terminal domain-containing protein [Bacteroidota bacterium]